MVLHYSTRLYCYYHNLKVLTIFPSFLYNYLILIGVEIKKFVGQNMLETNIIQNKQNKKYCIKEMCRDFVIEMFKYLI